MPEPEWFVGKVVHSLDPKGRLILPAKMRPLLVGTLYLTTHRDGCLVLFTEKVFSREIDKQRSVFEGGRGERDSVRAWVSTVEKCDLDGQGRLAVPPDLRSHAGIEPEGQVVVSGMIDFVELWSPTRFEELAARATAH